MVLNIEEDLGISLIFGRPFLRDARAIIDVGTGRISLLILGKKMKFRFQNKKQELFLRMTKEKGCMVNPAGKIGRSMSLQQSRPGKIGKFMSFQPYQNGKKGRSASLPQNQTGRKERFVNHQRN